MTFAQAAGELPELSTGQALTALAVLSAFGGSLLVYSLWAARWHQGRPVIPAAARKPHYVPSVVLAIGFLLMGMLIVSSLVAGEEQASQMVELSKNAAAEQEGESAPDADDRASGDASGEGAGADPTASERVATDGQGDSDASPAASQSDSPDGQTEGTADEDPEQQLSGLMLDLLTFDVILLLIFGGFVFMSRGPCRQVHDLEDIAIDAPYAGAARRAVAIESSQAEGRAVQFGAGEFVSDVADEADEADNRADNRADSQAARESPLHPFEPWSPATEFRFAAEAVLAAYLPTVLLRVILLSGQEEPTSHPLLEVMENGVSPSIMAMVFALAVVAAPVVEELVFRVVLCGGMIQRRLLWPGIVVSSVMFSMSHGYPDSVALLPLAVVLGYVYARRRSYRTVILVHFLFNAFNMGIALVQMIGPPPA